MASFLSDPVFLGLVSAILIVLGVIIGWSLREAFPERYLKEKLQLSEQNRNTLARLYKHLQYQHDLREADFRRTALELDRMRQVIAAYEQEKTAWLSKKETSSRQLENAEAKARLLAERIVALEAQDQKIRARNEEMRHELARMREELHAWKALHRNFIQMQHRLQSLEKSSAEIETDRNRLRQQLADARLHIEALEVEMLRLAALAQRSGSGTGRASATHKADEPVRDDLKIIHGISSSAELQLNKLGILTLAQISRWDDDTIIATAKKLGISPGKIYKDDWVGQARGILKDLQN